MKIEFTAEQQALPLSSATYCWASSPSIFYRRQDAIAAALRYVYDVRATPARVFLLALFLDGRRWGRESKVSGAPGAVLPRRPATPACASESD